MGLQPACPHTAGHTGARRGLCAEGVPPRGARATASGIAWVLREYRDDDACPTTRLSGGGSAGHAPPAGQRREQGLASGDSADGSEVVALLVVERAVRVEA